ncbi:MAG: dipeptide epimerase [Alphaproteobacteria bacterium]|nr:dipeptide epimerase [Alphaproteobacteria bacterium]
MKKRILRIAAETFPIAGAFRIARGAKTQAHVIRVEIEEDGAVGRGECVPYGRYGETIESVTAAIAGLGEAVAAGLTAESLQSSLPPGAARNALDCALWDLEAKISGIPVWRRAGLPMPVPFLTAYTISLASPAEMAASARECARPLLKLKLGEPAHDAARLDAIADAVPQCRLIVDANEGWSLDDLERLMPALLAARVELIEQPLPATRDSVLDQFRSQVPLCADESVHGLETLDIVARRYGYVNVKLDKTGGFTEALALTRAARARGLKVMLGCMVSTSLAMAPAALLAPLADVIDLDGPLLLSEDRTPRLNYRGATVDPPSPELWG